MSLTLIWFPCVVWRPSSRSALGNELFYWERRRDWIVCGGECKELRIRNEFVEGQPERKWPGPFIRVYRGGGVYRKERVIFTTNTRVTACRGQSSTCSKERKSFLRIWFARHKEKPLSQMLLYYTQDNNTILLPLLRIVAQPKKPQEVWNERTIPMPLLVLAVIQPCV